MNPTWNRLLKVAKGVANDAGKLASAWVGEAADADRLLQRSMASLIDLAGRRYPLDPGAQWKPGEPLKLLLVGYAGTRNTGADARVEEMLRQFRHLFGDDHVELSILTVDPKLTKGYFKTVRQLLMPSIFPKFVYDVVHTQHGVISCEGSMFKSKFANALSTLMVGALGVAAAEHKIAVGYGGEAGNMDRSLEDLIRTYLKNAYIIARNTASVDVLGRLGVQAKCGTDTAWTFEPAPDAVGREILMSKGWDGKTPILAVCPINPFWWPVKPDIKKGVERATLNLHKQSHYKSVYFHKSGAEVDEAQDRYLSSIATAMKQLMAQRDVFPILVGMEQIDRRSCAALNAKLDNAHPLFVSDEYDMYQLISVIRQADAMVSSRYHAIVTSMPGGVSSAGITMDERIRNLMADRGQPHLALEVDDPDLAANLLTVFHQLFDEGDEIREGIAKEVARTLVLMGRMGMWLVDYVRERHPEFPFRAELGSHGDPWDHLPPLSDAVKALITDYRSVA